ncbi:MAG: hypothetical protein ABIJ46_02450 [bacterium]
METANGVLAVVEQILWDGRHYLPVTAIARTVDTGQVVSFRLNRRGRWSEAEIPDFGSVVVLDGVHLRREGMRAYSARFWQLEDESLAIPSAQDGPVLIDGSLVKNDESGLITFSVACPELDGEGWLRLLLSRGIHVGNIARQKFRSAEFVSSSQGIIGVKILSFYSISKWKRTSADLWRKAQSMGFRSPDMSLAGLIRLVLDSERLKQLGLARVVVMHRDADSNPDRLCLFQYERRDSVGIDEPHRITKYWPHNRTDYGFAFVGRPVVMI